MSLSIENLKFTIYGSGWDDARADSGEGKVSSPWYDADGNTYEFDIMDARFPLAYPNSHTESDFSVNYRDNANNMWSRYYAYSSDFGRSVRRRIKSQDLLLFDVSEDDNWLTQNRLVGFSAMNLINMGLLEDRVGSSVKLFKNEPNSNTWVQCTITSKKNDNLFRYSSVAEYRNVDQKGYGISFLVTNPLHPQYSVDLRVDDFDIALCRLTRYDGTVGLGFCGTFAQIYPDSDTNPLREIYAHDRVWTDNKIFDCLNIYFGV